MGLGQQVVLPHHLLGLGLGLFRYAELAYLDVK